MKHITVLIPSGQVNMGTIATVVGVMEVFAEANAHWKRRGRGAGHRLQTAGIPGKVSFASGQITFEPECSIAEIKKTDLVIVPPSSIRSREQVEKGNRRLVTWIEQQYKQGAEVASMCSGVFMLAASGILKGRSCSAHWAHTEMFRGAFPDVELKEDKLIIHEAGIYTNGGAYSFLNLVLFIIEKYYDKATAVFCAKMFQVEIDRQSQSSFAIFSGQKRHKDQVILKAQVFIENTYQEKISMDVVSDKFGLGRRTFDRRFIKATGITPLDYLQRVKIEAAKTALENTRKTVNEVMYEVGYNDTKTFREVFGRVTGMSPLDYKMKYNQEYVTR